MKYMIGSGFSTEIYEWVWFYMNGGVLKILAVRLYIPNIIGRGPLGILLARILYLEVESSGFHRQTVMT
jgi:hypothetical protein